MIDKSIDRLNEGIDEALDVNQIIEELGVKPNDVPVNYVENYETIFGHKDRSRDLSVEFYERRKLN